MSSDLRNGERIGPATLARLRLAQGHRAPLDRHARNLEALVFGLTWISLAGALAALVLMVAGR